MNLQKKIIIADDDADDRNLATIAFKELNMMHSVHFVTDGQELIDCLTAKVNLSHSLPDVILLDLNMPRKDGRLALKEIKAHPDLKHLNVVVFSTSSAKEDIDYTMNLGAKNYIIKPSGYIELVSILKSICDEFVADSTF